MKSMPISHLPWELQLIFWVVLTLSGLGMGLATWFLIRYVKGQDDINTSNSDRFKKISQKVDELRSSYQTQADRMVNELHEVKKAALNIRQDTLEDIAQIKDDVRATKELTKIVETHQTVLKTVVVKLNNMMIIKSKKED